ncbi:MAG: hypothetical protein E6J77_24780, partial [Deltaproteobacteria bacterium]
MPARTSVACWRSSSRSGRSSPGRRSSSCSATPATTGCRPAPPACVPSATGSRASSGSCPSRARAGTRGTACSASTGRPAPRSSSAPTSLLLYEPCARYCSKGVEPYYLPIRDEVAVFTAAYTSRLPVLLKGPTGCGKTRFVEHMAYRLGGEATNGIPGNLITVACHEDLTGSDLVGRYLIKGDETIWVDGPLTRAVRSGTICYLDEIVEARKDTIVLIHPLTDHRRLLPIDKKGELLEAHPD